MRHVVVGAPMLEFCDNRVRNTRFTLLSFVPLVLKAQFSRYLNRYFLLIAVLQLIPGLSPTSALATWLPLLFILTVAAVRDGFDDFQVWKRDRAFNLQFGSIRVGQILQLSEGGIVPCDCVLLDRDVFVETTLLDGETDWKQKFQLRCELNAVLEVPPPSANVVEFAGRVGERGIGLGNVLFGGSVVRGVAEGSVSAVAIYTGVETKMSLNKSEARQKFTQVDEQMNFCVLLVFGFQMFLAIVFGSIGAGFADPKIFYLRLDDWNRNPLVFVVRWLLLFSIFIPISLYVTVTVAKLVLSIRLPEGHANNTSVIDDLGTCNVFCSDKTGTITRNVMKLEDVSASDDDELLRAVCICSSVQVLPSGQYLASSPDELALVEAASSRRVRLCGRKGDTVELQVGNTREVYTVLETLPFASMRRRMCVLVRNGSGQLTLFSKGSDDALLPRCSSGNAASQLLAFDRFAERGLRTLAVARRIVDESVVQRSGVLQARAQLDGGLALEQSFESLERLMELLGCVGIRDELQQNAVATIENLRLSRRFWILSGDKKQTLVCLAKSCGLSEVRDVDAHRNDEISESDDQTLHIAGTQFEQLSLPTQNRILRASCVIVSRCSPSQKALIVELLRRAGNVVCAIGDGGNDVSMIRVANIGIGLSGKEGAQASLAADFALPNFNALNSLLDVGKLAFARVFFIACYCFYKSFVLALLQALFGFLSLFSGVSLFSTLQLMLYNVLFTSLPVVLRVFDPSPPPTRSFRFSLLLWIARAAFQAVVVFLFCVLLADEASDLNLVAESAYLAVVATVSLTLLCESSAPTILWAFAVPAVPFSAVVLFVLSSIPGVREFGATPSLSGGLAALGATVVALFPFVLLKFGSIFSRRRAAEKFSDNELDFDL